MVAPVKSIVEQYFIQEQLSNINTTIITPCAIANSYTNALPDICAVLTPTRESVKEGTVRPREAHGVLHDRLCDGIAPLAT